jgi:putative ATP-binding cassette transporter
MSSVVLGLRTFLKIALPYFNSEDRWRARLLLAGVIGAELGLVYVAVSVTHWNTRFFNAIEQKSWALLTPEFLTFGFIVVGAILAGVSQYYFGQSLTIRWRRWMTQRYVGIWMADGRHYRQGLIDKSVDNIHLRIANDVYLFIQRTLELGTGVLGSFVSLVSFSYILWGLSAVVPLPLLGGDLSFPGYLIALAFVMATTGTLIGHFIGRALIPLQFNQQRCESDFRFAIARVTDNAEPVALMGGEVVERQELETRFNALVVNWVNIVHRQMRLTAFSSGYAQFSVIVPIFLGTPAYLAGAIPLGILIQASLAFTRVESAFGFFLAAYSKIAEWKAIIDRLYQLENAMIAVDAATAATTGIQLVTDRESGVSIRNLVLSATEKEGIAHLPALDIAAGEHLLIEGPSGSGKSCLLRAISGIWPFGSGRIARPAPSRVIALPQRRYFPLGTLRQAVAYPTLAATFTDADIKDAMIAAGIGALAHRLDEEADWSTVLSGGEQQRVGFARVLLHKPDLALLDEAVSTFEDSQARELYRILFAKLPHTTVVSVGRSSVLADLHRQTYEMNGRASPGHGLTIAAVPA